MLLVVAAASTYAGPVPETRDCVDVSRIKRTKIVDDSTLLFYMNGGEIFVNHLPRRCAGLRIADSFAYETSLSVLCNVDVIHVLRNIGGDLVPGPSCGLGTFQPITADEVETLLAGPEAEPEAVVPAVEPEAGTESSPGPDAKPSP